MKCNTANQKENREVRVNIGTKLKPRTVLLPHPHKDRCELLKMSLSE